MALALSDGAEHLASKSLAQFRADYKAANRRLNRPRPVLVALPVVSVPPPEPEYVPPPIGSIKLATLRRACCEVYDISMQHFMSDRRFHNLSIARQVYCYLARTQTDHSISFIAKTIGRDHSTACHGIAQVAANLGKHADKIAAVEKLLQVAA